MVTFSFQNMLQQGRTYAGPCWYYRGGMAQLTDATGSMFSVLLFNIYKKLLRRLISLGWCICLFPNIYPYPGPSSFCLEICEGLDEEATDFSKSSNKTKWIWVSGSSGSSRTFHLLFWMAPDTSCAQSGDPPGFVTPVWWAGGTYALHFVSVMPIPGLGGSAHSHSCLSDFLNGLLQWNFYRIEYERREKRRE